MRIFSAIKVLYHNKEKIKHLLLSITIFLLFGFAGISVFDYMQNRIIHENLTKTTETVKSMWSTATIIYQETMDAYLRYYILDEKTLKLLEMAQVPDRQPEVRLKIYRHLHHRFEELKSRLSVRHLNFVLPDNTMLIRFHTPHMYGDDVTLYRPSILYVNSEKKPFFGIELGKSILAYRYIFPVFGKDNRYLGCVELSRAFETIRRKLHQIDTDADYILLINKSELDRKVVEEYRGWYKQFANLEEWFVESTEERLVDAPKPIRGEYMDVLLAVNLKPVLNTKEDITLYKKHRDRYYKITAIKFSNLYEDKVSIVLLRVVWSEDIGSVIDTVFRFKIVYLILVGLISLGFFVYLERNYTIRLKNRELEIITSTMGSGLTILDDEGNVRFINDTALEIIKYPREEVLGGSLHDLIHHHTGPKDTCPIILSIKYKKEYSGDDSFMAKDGRMIDVHVKLKPLMVDGNYIGSILVFDDITERKQMEKRLFKLATQDPLTGLYNRRYAVEAMNNFKNQSDRYGYPLSVMMLDIDNFKKINDTFGHDIGDEVLKALAKTIKENIRVSDIPSRWGGEEFLIVLPNTDLNGAVNLAERIRESVSQTKVGPVSKFTVSIGVAQYQFGETLNALVIKADRGLYEAKMSGKNRVVFKQ